MLICLKCVNVLYIHLSLSLSVSLLYIYICNSSLEIRKTRNITVFFFYLGFFLGTFTSHRTAGEGGGDFFNFSLPQALGHKPDNYCREVTSTHRKQPDSNREPLVSEHKSLTTNSLTQVANHYEPSSYICQQRYKWYTTSTNARNLCF